MAIRHIAAAIIMTGMATIAHAGLLTDCGNQLFSVPGSMDFFCGALVNADLTGSNLTNADLGGADLTGAILTGSNLTNVDFSSANLTDANLTGTNLAGAIWTGTIITGINLTGSSETSTDLLGKGAYLSSPVSAVPEAPIVGTLIAGLALLLVVTRRPYARPAGAFVQAPTTA